MANLRDIRRRIKSVKSMAKLTSVMNMLAISKMKKSQQAALMGIAYADMLNSILNQVTARCGSYRHPLTEKRSSDRKLVVVLSSDRGLCGALNANLFRQCAKYNDDAYFVAVGAKAAQFLQKTRRNFIIDFSYSDPPLLSEARSICRLITQLFLDDEIDSADIVFSYFVSTFKQLPFTWKFLPVGSAQEIFEDMPESITRSRPSLTADLSMAKNQSEFFFEPDVESVYESLLLKSLDFQLLQIMREVRASVHSARMVAMKQATDNADEMVDALELTHNNLRQAGITKDILEISSASLLSE